MRIDTIARGEARTALITADAKVITDVPSALDLAMTVMRANGADRMLIPKKLAAEA